MTGFLEAEFAHCASRVSKNRVVCGRVGDGSSRPIGESECANEEATQKKEDDTDALDTMITSLTEPREEEVWNEPTFDVATGRAPSLFFGVPTYQSGLGPTSRTTQDVSYDAAIDRCVLVYC